MRSIAALLLVLLAVASAHAKPSKKVEAKLHYDAAITAYKAGEYDKAIEEFELGYTIAPEPQQLYNLAQACRLGKKLEKARDYYHKYLDANPDATNREVVMTRIQEVEKEIEDAKKPAAVPAAEPAPAAAPAASNTPPPTAAPDLKGPFARRTPYAVGFYIRPAIVTDAMLSPYLDLRTSMEGVMVGAQFIYRRRTFDVVTSVDFSWFPVKDGNYRGVGKLPDLDTKYVQFPNLSFLSADVAILGHNNLARWLEIFYGAGLGIGVVFGDVLVTTNHNACTAANSADIAACHPVGVDLTSPNRESQLAATEAPGQPDTAGSPHRHSASEKPPVMGVLNIQAGFRFKLAPRWTLQIDGGFRNSAFVGVGGHYWF